MKKGPKKGRDACGAQKKPPVKKDKQTMKDKILALKACANEQSAKAKAEALISGGKILSGSGTDNEEK